MAKVLMFGALSEVAGWRERTMEATTLSGLKALLTAENVPLGDRLSAPGVFAVLNNDMVRGDHRLEADDEVAFIPPVSGG